MEVMILTICLMAYIVVRTVAYGIYCIRTTGWVGGLSVFVLALCVIGAGYIALYSNRRMG